MEQLICRKITTYKPGRNSAARSCWLKSGICQHLGSGMAVYRAHMSRPTMALSWT